jgi:hypothetical protein
MDKILEYKLSPSNSMEQDNKGEIMFRRKKRERAPGTIKERQDSWKTWRKRKVTK